MKIAIVTDDGQTICQHFGRATKYAVVDIQNGEISSRELRDKAGHHTFSQHEEHHHHDHSHGRGMDAHSDEKHSRMVASIRDCELLLAGGMGRGAKISMDQAGIQVFQVSFTRIDEALAALIDGTIDQHVHEKLCGEHGHDH